MPIRAPRPCAHAGCLSLAEKGNRCPDHLGDIEEQNRNRGRGRETSKNRGYTARWQRYRRRYLSTHPLCVLCHSEGRIVSATVVDHVIRHDGDEKMFWDYSNHQALCKQCHDRKTATVDGGFGNVRKSLAD